MSRRKTVKVKDEKVSEVIERMLDGEIVGVKDGGLSKKVCWRFRDLRKKGMLKVAYSQDEKCSYLWFTEEVDRSTLEKSQSSLFGDLWKLVLGR